MLVIVVGGLLWWQPFTTKAISVATETVAEAPAMRVLAVNGQVTAETSVQVRSAVTGNLQGTMVAEGDLVVAGTMLAQVDPIQQQAVVRQAQSALNQGMLVQSKAGSDYARLRDLGTLTAKSALQDAQLTLAQAGQSVESLRAQVQQAQIQLERYTIRAAIAGTIVQRDVDPGQFIDPSTTLFSLSDLSHLVVQTNVDEAYATQIATGQTVTLQLVGTTTLLQGKVSFVSPRVDASTGGLEVKIAPDVALQAPVGLTVTANIVVDQHDKALTVPRTALTQAAVFLVKSGKAVKTPVEVIDWPAARLIVTSGLAVGDVVIADATGIKNGQAVKVAR